ncbi:16S rRNA (guanine(966)-N(2))-methyltransferase RsmD [Bombiscardovia coagulans]|uniref:DNA methyltransferase n=1 Tax=Bombiscardovia coagulans TaxID=686666 RepID=A0A261EV06_9BIFI|nr:16S rRNA (guanine(966)-N(2))-methyltransferase RsmD [Bombiscardovia coagulans]OZG50683.1 DNA methyltransferase [Bombiscardovia coagulans]
MRVIAGRFKGLLIPSALQGTRPTTDRTKEAIFSHLDAWSVLENARVLDLFAGTGALGFEALSRGATSLVSVESSRKAAALLSRTLKELKAAPSWTATDYAQVVSLPVDRYLESMKEPRAVSPEGTAHASAQTFDVIFMDPPYDVDSQECDTILEKLISSGLVTTESIVILERSTRSQPPQSPQGWGVSQAKTYGETVIYYIECE